MTTPATPSPTAPTTLPSQLTAVELDRAGLLRAERGVEISRFAVFVPADALGTLRPVTLRSGAVIGAFAVVHGGTTIGEQARIEEHAVAGTPERGYVVGRIHPGAGGGTVIGAGAVVRSGASVYADVHLGVNVVVGSPHAAAHRRRGRHRHTARAPPHGRARDPDRS